MGKIQLYKAHQLNNVASFVQSLWFKRWIHQISVCLWVHVAHFVLLDHNWWWKSTHNWYVVSVLSLNLECFWMFLFPSDGDMPYTVATQPPRLHQTMRNLRDGGVRVGTGQQTGKSLSLIICCLLKDQLSLVTWERPMKFSNFCVKDVLLCIYLMLHLILWHVLWTCWFLGLGFPLHYNNSK